MSFFHKYKQVTALFMAILITAGLYAPITSTAPETDPFAGLKVQKAHAIPVFDAAAFGQRVQDSATQLWNTAKNTFNAATNFIQTGNSIRDFFKEFFADPIAFAVARAVLKSMVNEMVRWINSGFQGSPAFVSDLGGFLLDVADEAAGDFIYGTQLGVLCSPFELDIRIALALQYQADRDFDKVKCTLSGVVNNVENFLRGEFAEGGWAGWFEITARPENTPTGAYLRAEAELQDIIIRSQDRELKLLDFGDGFFSTTICEAVEGEGTTRENCFISTPGKIIEEQLSFQLDSGRQSLIQADEINEIIGALFAQLAQQAVGGLSQMLQGGFGGDPGVSFLDAFAAETEGDALADGGIFTDAIADELRFIDLQEAIMEEIEDMEARSEAAAVRSVIIIPGRRIDDDEGPDIQLPDQVIDCYALQTPTALDRAHREASSSIPVALSNILTLQEFAADFENTDSPLEKGQIVQNFTELQTLGILHDEVAIQLAETEFELSFRLELDEFADDIAAEEARCAALRAELLNGDDDER